MKERRDTVRNLYQKFKAGLLGATPAPSRILPQVSTTTGQYGIVTYHITDADGREIALHRTDAVVIKHGLDVALKMTK